MGTFTNQQKLSNFKKRILNQQALWTLEIGHKVASFLFVDPHASGESFTCVLKGCKAHNHS